MLPSDPPVAATTVRCAVYTRKSTDDGLSQEFNSLDAQRECAEAYIQSQRCQGWSVLPQHYDDGGFSGANLSRPALKRLLADIEAGAIDCVVIYKVDRLSRSLFDFARLMQIFEAHRVSFVAVTQQFNSSTPMGRLTLNILLSFAAFERELVSERTRDKVAAARKKGKWMGGCRVLGYDPDSGQTRLVMNEAEAQQVRWIFERFVRDGSLMGALEEIQSRGWRLKSWTTRKGHPHVGGCWDRPALVRLLSNVLYVGDVKYRGQVYPGEQPGIVDRAIWRQANELLDREKHGSRGERRRLGALLQGLLVCRKCGKRMIPGYTTKRGRRYSYYVCLTAQKGGARACAGGMISGPGIEKAVVTGLYELACKPGGKKLQQRLATEAAEWEEWGAGEQRGLVEAVVEQLRYEGGRVWMRLRAEWAGEGGAEVVMPIGKKTAPRERRDLDDTGDPVVPTRAPRITRLMALAIRLEELIGQGVAKDYAELARIGGVSRSRITQILNLRNLAPELQERILEWGTGAWEGHRLTEGALRQISGVLKWREQIDRFNELLRKHDMV